MPSSLIGCVDLYYGVSVDDSGFLYVLSDYIIDQWYNNYA